VDSVEARGVQVGIVHNTLMKNNPGASFADFEAIANEGVVGFDHMQEKAQTYRVKGGSLVECSRCWKCRGLYLYEMGREDDYGGKGACNPALNCAEDFCHCFCRGQRTFCLDKDKSLN
jgi:hypothetical protein